MIALSHLTKRIVLFAVAAVLLCTGTTSAGVIGPGLPDFLAGDLLSGGVSDHSDDDSLRTFSLTMFVQRFRGVNGPPEFFGGSGTILTVEANYRIDGGAFDSGRFAITDWFGDVVFLKGTIWNSEHEFATQGGKTTLNMTLRANGLTGGTDGEDSVDNDKYVFPFEGEAGIFLGNLHVDGSAPGSLADYFNLTPLAGTANVARPVPEPASVAFFVLMGLVGFKRRKAC